jgi:hypothetical protein
VMTSNGSAYRLESFAKILRAAVASRGAPGPTRPGPTARPHASSSPVRADGPRVGSTPAPMTGPGPSSPGLAPAVPISASKASRLGGAFLETTPRPGTNRFVGALAAHGSEPRGGRPLFREWSGAWRGR